MPKTFSITTAIPYVNGSPHMGHALEFVETDCIARYHRLVGDRVYFLTGTDEHGTKIVQTAEKAGIPVKKLVDKNVGIFKKMLKQFEITNDDFIRTTDRARHWPSAAKLWKAMEKNGDIYKGKYKGLYCVGCEEYKIEKDLVAGLCPNHEKKPEYVEQENYFFRLSKYSSKIASILKSEKVKIYPKFRSHEIIALCERGLDDVSFSRPKSQLSWGIPVPGDKDQVMYVWCDALTNYISAMDYAKNGKRFKTFWPADLHVIGKDILRFHAGVWLGMLLSAALPLPKAELVHGWIHYQGDRMSKSKGNVVDPVELANHYGMESVRYYLLSEIPVGQDGDFSYQLFENKINADLAHNLGNFVNRVLSMVERYRGGRVPNIKTDIPDALDDLWEDYHLAMSEFQHQKALMAMISLVNFGNKLIADLQPWDLAKVPEKDHELDIVLRRLLKILVHLSFMLYPMLPSIAETMMNSLGLKKYLNTNGLNLLQKNVLLSKTKKIKKPELLFQLIDEKKSWKHRDVKKVRIPTLPIPITAEAKKLGLPVVAFALTDLKPLGTAREKQLKKEWVDWLEGLRKRPLMEKHDVQTIVNKAYELNTSLGVQHELPGNALVQQYLADPNKEFPFINPIVALYNFIEAKYGLSLGAHDLRLLKGEVTLKICDGTEHYFPLGANAPKKVPKGTYAYCDDEGKRVICWLEVKQGIETMVSDKTTDVLFVLQGYQGVPISYVEKAAAELKGLMERYLK